MESSKAFTAGDTAGVVPVHTVPGAMADEEDAADEDGAAPVEDGAEGEVATSAGEEAAHAEAAHAEAAMEQADTTPTPIAEDTQRQECSNSEDGELPRVVTRGGSANVGSTTAGRMKSAVGWAESLDARRHAHCLGNVNAGLITGRRMKSAVGKMATWVAKARSPCPGLASAAFKIKR